MADSSILDGNRWPHWGQFCGLSAAARVDLRGGPPERLEPVCGCNSSARSINSYDMAGLILPCFILHRTSAYFDTDTHKSCDSNYLGSR
jgi:hypothetical protein